MKFWGVFKIEEGFAALCRERLGLKIALVVFA
jgi:hypothetical protein